MASSTKNNQNDKQDVSIRETESTPRLVDVSVHETENSDTTKGRSDASKNGGFPTIVVNSKITKAIIAAGPKQLEKPSPKDPLQNGRQFLTQASPKLRRY